MTVIRATRYLAQFLASLPCDALRRGVRFLCYHSIVAEPSSAISLAPTTISAEDFSAQLEWFSAAGFTIVPMVTALDLLRSGTARRGTYLCLTFDDGRMDNYLVAWPILRGLGLSAHFFVTSDRIGRSGETTIYGRITPVSYMGPGELRRIVSEGGSIGAHGRSHARFTEMDETALLDEVRKSREAVEDVVGSAVLTVAYPHGQWDRKVTECIRKSGYDYGFTIETGRVRSITERNRYALPRVLMFGDPRAWMNRLAVRGGYDWTMTYGQIRRFLARIIHA